MKTIAKIIELHGGLESLKDHHIVIENAPYMRLVIQRIEDGPRGLPAVSISHNYVQEGDLMRDPEMVFEVSGDTWSPTMYQQDNMGLYQEAVFTRDGQVYIRPALIKELKSFARVWDRNLRAQKFIEAYQNQKAVAA
jgi:hypothetical protein